MCQSQGHRGLGLTVRASLCSLRRCSFGALDGSLTETLLFLNLQCSPSQTAKVSGHLLREGPLGSHCTCERLELGASGDIFPSTFLTHL